MQHLLAGRGQKAIKKMLWHGIEDEEVEILIVSRAIGWAFWEEVGCWESIWQKAVKFGKKKLWKTVELAKNCRELVGILRGFGSMKERTKEEGGLSKVLGV